MSSNNEELTIKLKEVSMGINFTGCTFQEKDAKNKVKVNTIGKKHHYECECGHKWESGSANDAICEKCVKN